MTDDNTPISHNSAPSNDGAMICPSCQQGHLLAMDDGTLVCLQCGERFVNPQRLCPFCEAENAMDAQICSQCGRALRRTCPRCQTVNLITADKCVSCGQPLDTFGHIAAREELRFADRFTRHAHEVAEVTADQQAQSQRRLDQMWDVERKRQAALAAQRQVQHRQEQRMVTAAIIIFVLAIVIVVGLALLTAPG
jgi:hypothetical protein